MEVESIPPDPEDTAATVDGPKPPKTGLLRQPGFGWGLGIGAIVVVLLFVCGALVLGTMWYRLASRDYGGGPSQIVVSPVEAGEPWFEVSGDGTGVLEGWPYGSYGSGDDDSVQYFFDVFEIGSVNGVTIQHVVGVAVDDDTEFFVGEQPYKAANKGNQSAADAIFGTMEDSGSAILDGEMKLRVEFRIEGDKVLATRVTADPSSEPTPYLY